MASAVIGALRVNLGIDTAQFNDGLKSMRSNLASVGKQLQGWGTRLSTYVSAPITAAGGAIAVAAGQMAKDIDQLRKNAQISNVGFEEFQKLAFAARSVGVEGDKLADIFKDVNDRVGDFNATGGGPMKDFFDNIAPKIGLTAEAFKDLSGPEALQLYYDSLKKAGASQQDLTFYLEAMASDATALIPLLEQGGEGFRKLGEGAAVISADQADGLKEYNDSMRALGEAVKGLTVAIATSGILEFVTGLAEHLTTFVQTLSQTNPELLKWGTIVAGLAAAIGPAVAALGLFVTAIAAISAPVAATVAGVAALTTAIIAFWPEITNTATAIQNFLTGAWASFEGAWDGMVQKVEEVRVAIVQFANDILTAFAALPGQMLEIGGQIIDGLWNGIKAKWESVKGGISEIGDSIYNGVADYFIVRSPSRLMHELGTYIMQGLANGMSEAQGSVVSIAKDTANQVSSALSSTEGSFDTLGQSASNAFSGLGNSIAGLINGTKEWSDVLSEIIGKLADVAINALSSSLGYGSGFGNFFSGFASSLFGFARGGTILPGGAGGIDSQLVMFRKSPNERVDITKPGQSLGSGQAVQVNIINNSNATVNQRERQTANGTALDVLIDEAVAKKINTPGSSSRSALQGQYGLKGSLAKR